MLSEMRYVTVLELPVINPPRTRVQAANVSKAQK